MNNLNKKFVIVILFLLSGVAPVFAVAQESGEAVYRPVWIEMPKSDDSIYMYRVGSASGVDSAVRARAAAFENAIDVILDEIMARAGIAVSDRHKLRGKFAVQGVEQVPDAVFYEETASGFSCWIQISCPLAEKDRLLEEMAAAKEILMQSRKKQEEFNAVMRGLWQDAKTASLRGEHSKALAALLDLEQNYADINEPGFELEELRILLGDTQNALKNRLDARAAYETVSGMSTSLVWRTQARQRLETLPDPPRFWPMRGRWNSGKVALLCVIRKGSDTKRFADLVNVFTRDCVETRMDSVDITDGCGTDTLDRFFDKMDFTEASRAALAGKADIVLGVLYDIDPDKKGVTVENFGVKMPVPDAVVRFFVVDPHKNINIFNGQFKEITGGRPENVLAERVALLLISKHLVPGCPAIGQ